MATPEGGLYAEEQEREKALAADRELEKAPLPYSHVRQYPSEEARQADLAAAEPKNIARAAGELGLTSEEWATMRAKLGRSPRRGDV